ncbi:hypothetical protein H696_00649 [Fonticula alba]|uniref:Uncharacterized protein n=1 Tax=Fonticula alba TaxID=691883 RepID=A0A058ZFH4_FONAL|nr:hypothetical protein H696_00649 [Fonticula alba]KCV73104.1 hypothetical protein H696_00649 [Fonticula alba]|eukprot:XP_009492805.1 hypothetical protein H696_00649 [Fonticula alba]
MSLSRLSQLSATMAPNLLRMVWLPTASSTTAAAAATATATIPTRFVAPEVGSCGQSAATTDAPAAGGRPAVLRAVVGGRTALLPPSADGCSAQWPTCGSCSACLAPLLRVWVDHQADGPGPGATVSPLLGFSALQVLQCTSDQCESPQDASVASRLVVARDGAAPAFAGAGTSALAAAPGIPTDGQAEAHQHSLFTHPGLGRLLHASELELTAAGDANLLEADGGSLGSEGVSAEALAGATPSAAMASGAELRRLLRAATLPADGLELPTVSHLMSRQPDLEQLADSLAEVEGAAPLETVLQLSGRQPDTGIKAGGWPAWPDGDLPAGGLLGCECCAKGAACASPDASVLLMQIPAEAAGLGASSTGDDIEDDHDDGAAADTESSWYDQSYVGMVLACPSGKCVNFTWTSP